MKNIFIVLALFLIGCDSSIEWSCEKPWQHCYDEIYCIRQHKSNCLEKGKRKRCDDYCHEWYNEKTGEVRTISWRSPKVIKECK